MNDLLWWGVAAVTLAVLAYIVRRRPQESAFAGEPTFPMTADEAWVRFLRSASTDPGWLEDSTSVSESIGLSKRELLGLILLAQLLTDQEATAEWRVGYDPADPEPNDGYVTDGSRIVRVEHTIVPQPMTPAMAKRPALEGILRSYGQKASKGGIAYGRGRTLLIFANRDTSGLIRVSRLREESAAACPFDQVILMHAMEASGSVTHFAVSAHHPSTGIAQVDLDFDTGTALVANRQFAVRVPP